MHTLLRKHGTADIIRLALLHLYPILEKSLQAFLPLLLFKPGARNRYLQVEAEPEEARSPTQPDRCLRATFPVMPIPLQPTD